MTEDAQLLPVEAIVEEVLGLHPSGWTLVQHTTKTILRLAGLGHTILVGRGATSSPHASRTYFTYGWWHRLRREFGVPANTTT
jgi:hypothetical protein